MRIVGLFVMMFLWIQCSTSKVNLSQHKNTIIGFYCGPLNDLYRLDSEGDFSILDESLQKSITFNNRLSGNYTMADVTNPQKILLYAPFNNKIQFLDNNLSELESVTIPFDLYPEVPAVALSNDNQFWFWDAVNQQLVKMKLNNEVTTTSNRMYDYGLRVNGVNSIQEKDNHVYIQSDGEVLIFDNFGQYLNRIKVDPLGTISFQTNSISYITQEYQWMTIVMPLMNEIVTPPIANILQRPNDIIKVDRYIYLVYDDKIEKRLF